MKNENNIILSPIVDTKVFFAFKDDKVGIIHKELKDYNIPIKYDRIIYANGFEVGMKNRDVVAYVRKDNKWGAYCYMVDYHERYSEKNKVVFEQEYVRKRFVPPMFDTIQLIENDGFDTMFFKVSINGKYGVLDAYNNKFKTPVIFDKIDKIKISITGETEVYGVIDGNMCISKGHETQVLTPLNVDLSNEYKLVRKKIEKRED